MVLLFNGDFFFLSLFSSSCWIFCASMHCLWWISLIKTGGIQLQPLFLLFPSHLLSSNQSSLLTLGIFIRPCTFLGAFEPVITSFPIFSEYSFSTGLPSFIFSNFQDLPASIVVPTVRMAYFPQSLFDRTSHLFSLLRVIISYRNDSTSSFAVSIIFWYSYTCTHVCLIS